MDGGAWKAAVHGVAKSRARQNDFTFPFHFHALEKEMAPHSSILAGRIPWTEEPEAWTQTAVLSPPRVSSMGSRPGVTPAPPWVDSSVKSVVALRCEGQDSSWRKMINGLESLWRGGLP